MKDLLHNIEQDNLNGINQSLKALLYDLSNYWTKIQYHDVSEAEAALFREWFENQSIEKLGESLAVRCLALIRHFPILCGFDYLYHNFLNFCGKADLHLNPHDLAAEHIFAALIETISVYLRYPENEEEFTQDIASIEQTVKEKIQKLKEAKTTLPEKYAEYARLYDDPDYKNSHQLLFEIFLAENELRQFLFANTDIPLCYMLYFIALDEFGHFTPLVRQAAISGLRNAYEDFLWKKFLELRSYFLTIYPVFVPIIPDVTVSEFAHSIEKALCFWEAEYDYKTVYEISHVVLEIMPDCRDFLYRFPLAISNATGDALLTGQWTALAYREFHDIKDKGHSVKRFIEILDYTLPNSRGIPAVLFKYKELTLPFIRREYLRYKSIDNEAELRLRSVNDPYSPPKLIRSQNPEKARDLVSTFMEFLELYAQGDI